MSYLSPIRWWRQMAGRTAVTAGVSSLLLMWSCSGDRGLETRDVIPPSGVTSLHCDDVDSTEVLLTWTAPGDDGSAGTAAVYDIRYSTSPIDPENWDSASQVSNEPQPLPAQRHQTFTVTGLSPQSVYFFALKTADAAANWSVLSNVAIGDLTPPAVSFHDPLPDDAVNGIMTIQAIATDNHMVRTVEFFIDNCLGFVDSVAPWVYYWNYAAIDNGENHRIQIKALDAAGNESLPKQLDVLVPSNYTDETPPIVSSIAYEPWPQSIRITFREEGAGIDWDSVFVDLYLPAEVFEDYLPASRLLHTFTPGDFVPVTAPCDNPETIVILPMHDIVFTFPYGRRLKVVVFGGIRNQSFAETCSCAVHTYDFVRGGVRDLAGNHTEVVEEIITIRLPPY
ncbi:MAG: fibronectin type III domain-containing protein [candidate division Zixibacteria bacterium]|nr:fibronectin type III domain-containing protein [candidate division Zixibacteria bacterium]